MVFTNFTWWSVLFVLLTTHITILTVTIYLHRSVAHRSLSVAKPLEHFFRFWCWLTTGQCAKEWAAVHRKHHAFCEKEQDPHSPRIYGFWTVLFKGVALYRKEAKNPETLDKYGKMTPDDWIEKNLYAKHSFVGLVGLALFDLFLFGAHGIWVYLVQIAWIPFWAAGVINGLGHFRGYRNFNTDDDSTNISPLGLIIGGEELHNNHHAYPTSAKFSMKWYEFDLGWVWIKALQKIKLVKVNKVYTLPIYDKTTHVIGENTLQVFMSHRYFIWKMFTKQTKLDVKISLKNLKENHQDLDGLSIRKLKKIFYKTELNHQEQKILNKLLEHHALKSLYDYKQGLLNMWNDKHITYAQLKEKLHIWCESAKQSQQHSIKEFAQKLIWLKPAK